MIAASLLLVIVSGGSTADLEGNGPSKTEPLHNYIGVNLGFASSVGEVGLTYDRDLTNQVQLQLGVGAGFTGWQFSIMPKLILRTTPSNGFFFGAGPSLAVDQTSHTKRGWGNFEAGYQYERWHFFLQFAVGYTVLLHGEVALDCGWCSGDKARIWGAGDGIFTSRLALGVRF